MRLRTRLIIFTSLLLSLLMAGVILLTEKRQCEMIASEARKRGLAFAWSLAAVSTNDLVTYNYPALERNAEKVASEEDIVYVIIHDKENKVAAYSGHDEKQGTFLADEVSERALQAVAPFIQAVCSSEGNPPILDISVPVYIKESTEKWGTIRIGLSLARMEGQLVRTRRSLYLLGIVAITLGMAGSVFFARRITRPLSALVRTTIEAAQGNLNQTIDISTGDEVEELGKNFNHMIEQIRLHRNVLEERLHEITSLKTYTDNILSSMTNGLLTVDLEGRIITLNETAERLLGASKYEACGFLVAEVLGNGHPLCRMVRETLLGGERIFEPELEVREEDRTLWLAATTSPLVGGDGGKIGVLAVFQDITELKGLEEKLRQADRLAALGTLSAGLAHEIKNPLSAIKTFVQLLPQKLENQAFLEKFSTTVPREIERINQLVEDLLELTRTRKRTLVPLDINYVISQVIDLHGEEMAKKKIFLEKRLNTGLPAVFGDSEALYRALSNLVINSVQAMPNGGILEILTEQENSAAPMVRITIRDTGIGMDEITAKNLFNPFFTTKAKGVGLGMALSRKIIEDHRGTIEVLSEKEKGTTYILRIPVVKM